MFVLKAGSVFAQTDNSITLLYKTCDTVSQNIFDKKIKLQYRKMKHNKEFSISDFILLVKLYLTIPETLKGIKNEKLYRKFIKYYRTKYMNKYCEIMDCTFRRGVVLYSNKYAIYLSKPQNQDKLPCYNYFFIR